MKKPRVLHITPHLGGGVGKAVTGLILNAYEYEHAVLLLEPAINSKYTGQLLSKGIMIYHDVDGSRDESFDFFRKFDILQVEFWNHPLTTKFLSREFPKARWVLWCHISGVHNPIIPEFNNLWATIVRSTPCVHVQDLGSKTTYHFQDMGERSHYPYVCSAAGVERASRFTSNSMIFAGRTGKNFLYFGTADFAKMHPDYGYAATTILRNIPNSTVTIVGGKSLSNPNKRLISCVPDDLHSRLLLVDETHDPTPFLYQSDYLLYLLNPFHYGTSENALVEAMSLGVIPIVMGNPAETCIVKDNVTGIVLNYESPGSTSINLDELTTVATSICTDPRKYHEIRDRCMRVTNTLYDFKYTAASFERIYDQVMKLGVSHLHNGVFGQVGHHNFLAFQKQPSDYREPLVEYHTQGPKWITINGDDYDPEMYIHTSPNKGSAIHFARYYPDDEPLKQWANELITKWTPL